MRTFFGLVGPGMFLGFGALFVGAGETAFPAVRGRPPCMTRRRERKHFGAIGSS